MYSEIRKQVSYFLAKVKILMIISILKVIKTMNRTPSKQNPQHTFEVYTQIILKDVREAKQYAIDHNLIDTQEFLDFMDALNELSIDPDRK
jgi:hypothetical protein